MKKNNFNIQLLWAEFKQILRFLLVGGLAAFVDLTVSGILFYVVGIQNYRIGICSIFDDCSSSFLYGKFEEIVSSISFFVGFIFSYIGHAKYTFKTGTSRKSLFRLLLLAFVNVFLRALIISIEKTYSIDGYLSIVISLIMVTAISYIMSKYWVFKA